MGSRLQARGFTLIELVMVILLLGVMATFSSQFIGIGTQIYGDASRREQLMSDARFAMERLNRELRDAVPGSVRVEEVGGAQVEQGACLRFWPIATASRYLGSAVSSGLSVVTPTPLPTANQQAIVYPIADNTPGNSITLDKGCVYGNCVATVTNVGTAVAGVLPVTVKTPFAKDSPGRRIYFADKQVRYCVTGNTLNRTCTTLDSSNGACQGQAASALMAEHIRPAAYYFYREPAAFSPSEVGLRLRFEQRGESVSFNHKLEVPNVP